MSLEPDPLEAELDAGGVAGAAPLAAELDELGELGLAAEGVDGVAGVDDAAPPLAPPEAEPEADPLGLEGEVLLGEVAELELEEPGVDEVLFLSPLSHAARPKASATAAAKMESFMCPPWLGYKTSEQRARPAQLLDWTRG